VKASKILVLTSILGASEGLANVTGSDLQNFNATTNGLDFITVQSSETLAPGVFNLGLFANYAVNTLPRYEDIAGRKQETSDSITAADFNIGYGLTENWDIGVSFPQVVAQDVKIEGARGEFGQKGLTEVRANTKFRLYGDPTGGIALVLSGNINVTENNPYVGEGGGPTFNAEIAMDTTVQKLALGVNFGYRKRSPGKRIEEFPIAPLQDQFIASAAASYLLTSIDTKIILEWFGGWPKENTETIESRSVESGEALLGIKHDINDQFSLHAGVGTETRSGTASPDMRYYLGANYAFGFDEARVINKVVKPKPKPKPKKGEPPPPPEPPKFMPEQDGPQETPGGDEVFVLRGVNFAFDSSSRVLPGTREILNKLGDHLKKNGFEKVIIEGHTDSVGSELYNQNLGQSRANTIRSYLIRYGSFNPGSLEAKSYGENKPIADNGNYQGRQLNRRVVFRIFYKH
jgi:outer membrane protein OmpA-like peptidoglycan-associated protein